MWANFLRVLRLRFLCGEKGEKGCIGVCDLRYLLLLGIKPFSNSFPILTANQWPSLPSYSVSTTRKTSPLVKARLCGVSFSHSKWLLIKNESPLPQASISLYTERQKHRCMPHFALRVINFSYFWSPSLTSLHLANSVYGPYGNHSSNRNKN